MVLKSQMVPGECNSSQNANVCRFLVPFSSFLYGSFPQCLIINNESLYKILAPLLKMPIGTFMNVDSSFLPIVLFVMRAQLWGLKEGQPEVTYAVSANGTFSSHSWWVVENHIWGGPILLILIAATLESAKILRV